MSIAEQKLPINCNVFGTAHAGYVVECPGTKYEINCTAGELHGSPLARLALETLGSFNFGPIGLLEFAREHVLQWLDDADISVRKAAALCAARILNRHVTETKRPARHLVRRCARHPFAAILHWRFAVCAC